MSHPNVGLENLSPFIVETKLIKLLFIAVIISSDVSKYQPFARLRGRVNPIDIILYPIELLIMLIHVQVH